LSKITLSKSKKAIENKRLTTLSKLPLMSKPQELLLALEVFTDERTNRGGRGYVVSSGNVITLTLSHKAVSSFHGL
jgi:hypothetical protein